MPVSRSIVDNVLKKGQGVRTSDARTDRRFVPGQSILQAGIREAMCVPMQGRYDVLGVIYVDTTTPPERVVLEGGVTHKFSEDQLRLLVAIGSQAALAIERALRLSDEKPASRRSRLSAESPELERSIPAGVDL